MHTSVSPYVLIQEANDTMKKMILEFPKKKETRVIQLINSAETYPNMSAYQIEQARIMLIDLYISHKIYGSAYDLCKIVQGLNPKASVKRKIKMLEKIRDDTPEEFIFSCDQNMVDEAMCFEYLPPTDVSTAPEEVYDAEFEAEIESRLSRMGEPYKSEFYRQRPYRKADGVLSSKDLDLLTLEAMERSFDYQEGDPHPVQRAAFTLHLGGKKE